MKLTDEQVQGLRDGASLTKRLEIKAAMIRMGEPIAWGSDADALEEAADTIERLTRERDQANAAAEGHEAKWQSICKAERSDFGTCACSYDEAGDVCLYHSPQLAAAEARIAKLEAALRTWGEAFATGRHEPLVIACETARAALEEPT